MVTGSIKPKEGKVFSGENLRWSWYRACVAAGVGEFFETGDPRHPRRYKGLNIHDLRRSALNNFRKQGVPEVVAMKFSGHAERAVFDRYNIVDVAEQRDAMKRIEQASRRVGSLLGGNEVSNKSFIFKCPSGGTGRRASFRS